MSFHLSAERGMSIYGQAQTRPPGASHSRPQHRHSRGPARWGCGQASWGEQQTCVVLWGSPGEGSQAGEGACWAVG